MPVGKPHRPSSIDRLPAEVREQIGELRRNGRTIDEIMAKLDELGADVSRSAVGRHVLKIAVIGEKLRESRAVAESLVAQFGEQPDNRLAQVNIELMHSVVMQTITAAAPDPETGEMQPVTFDAEQAMFLARAMQSLSSAEKTNSDRVIKAREEAKRELAAESRKKLEAAGKSGDIDPAAVARAKRILGFD